MYKHVFIDLDDTLWDFHANARESLIEVFEQRKLEKYFDDFDHFFQIYAKRNLELWELYGKGEVSKDYLQLERFRHPLVQVGVNNDELAEQIGTQFLDILPTKTILIPHAIELLEYLSPKYPLTIVSNGFVEVQYRKLRATNLEHYFSHVVLSEAAGALKPDKRIFEYALSLNNATAAETIMIGDSYEADIIGAQNAGIDQIFLDLGHSKDKEIKTTFQINGLEEILSIL
ncbi:MAG: YjjG family noncanonical pyrimidine nucleotidase [Paludibacter sp.]|nr:YjjG family noncanonical pyrimidine nucleotidase [Paludibacter sp.]